MAPQPTPARSSGQIVAARLRLLAVALAAVILAAGSVSPAIALSPATAVAVATVQASPAPPTLGAPDVSASATGFAYAGLSPTGPVRPVVATPPAKPPKAPAKPKPAAAISFRGTNHVWIPALGIDRSTFSFPCSRAQAPANYVYRWGCAGSNNLYLIGHAYGVFKALHDAYYNGRLRVGLTAVYADGAGRIHTYRVSWWRVVRPTTAAKWAWASLASPGMTLQTCLGANSEYRLMVRLVRVS
jgi:hypothetical protein